MGQLEGRVALVTGGGRGIGRAIAEALAAAGAAVTVTARTQPDLDQTVAAITAAGGRAHAITADVRDPASVAQVVAETEQVFGPVDVLVNNAAVVNTVGPLWEADPAEWATVVDINLTGPFLCARAVLPGMVQRHRGCIINLTSVGGLVAIPYAGAYVVTKTALLRLTELLAMETKEHGVAVFALDPGAVLTDMTRQIIASPATERWTPWFRAGIQQNAQPAAVPAAVCVTLASGAADALSGWYLHPRMDLAALVTRAEDLRKEERHVLRVRVG